MGSMEVAKVNQDDLVYLGELLAAGKITPVIDRCYPLNEIAEAFRYVEEKHPKEKLSSRWYDPTGEHSPHALLAQFLHGCFMDLDQTADVCIAVGGAHEAVVGRDVQSVLAIEQF